MMRGEVSLSRPTVDGLDRILGVARRVLDDGFVRLVDYMGDDAAIVQAARISYGSGTSTKRSDRGLIRYLMRKRHTTPFEMCELKVHVRAPMDTWRQWIRHRTASVNEYSTRYSLAIEAMASTDPSKWRKQSTVGRQGSEGFLPLSDGGSLSERERLLQEDARAVYGDRIQRGVAREQARKDLPLSTYTEAYWKIDLHNLLHFLELRLAPSSQEEIRHYAESISEIVKEWVPLTWEAFEEYRLASLTLSRGEVAFIRRCSERCKSFVAQSDEIEALSAGEQRELRRKLRLLGILGREQETDDDDRG